jgi:hypothetical protein
MNASDFGKRLTGVFDRTMINIRQILANEGLKAVARSKETLLKNKNYASGRLYKSITAIQDGNKLEFGTNVPYAIDIETGISSSTPTVDDIREWSKRKVELGHIEKSILGFSKTIVGNISSTGRIKHWGAFIEPSFAIMVKEVSTKLKDAVIQD